MRQRKGEQLGFDFEEVVEVGELFCERKGYIKFNSHINYLTIISIELLIYVIFSSSKQKTTN